MSFNVTEPVQNLQSSQSYSSLNRLNLILPKRSEEISIKNITSLVKHIDELRVFLASNEIDVLAINETRLDATISDNEVHIHGYEIVRRDRKLSGRLGGDVCIYVRNSMNFSIRHDLSIDQPENLCISIKKHKSKPFLVSTWYRPPSSPVEKFEYFESLLSRLDLENIEFYLLGDLNCDLSSTVLDHALWSSSGNYTGSSFIPNIYK